jgi:hypothetical protein
VNDAQGRDPAATNRVAFAALKHSFEKVGDHWKEKDLGVTGRSKMTKQELGQAIARKQR